jgi:hypothetical protein
MKFSETIELNGKTATGIEVPDDVVEVFGRSQHPAVRVASLWQGKNRPR